VFADAFLPVLACYLLALKGEPPEAIIMVLLLLLLRASAPRAGPADVCVQVYEQILARKDRIGPESRPAVGMSPAERDRLIGVVRVLESAGEAVDHSHRPEPVRTRNARTCTATNALAQDWLCECGHHSPAGNNVGSLAAASRLTMLISLVRR
jgi:hypothetical protein